MGQRVNQSLCPCLFPGCISELDDDFTLDAHMKVHFESPDALNTHYEPSVTGCEEPGRQGSIASSVATYSTGAHFTGMRYHGLTASSPVDYSPAAQSTGGRHASALVAEPLVTEQDEPVHQRLTASNLVAHSPAAPFTMPTKAELDACWDDRTYICLVCSKANFTWPDEFRRHMRKHVPGPRPYECPELGCSCKGELGFYRKDKLTDHLRNRHGRDIPKKRELRRDASGWAHYEKLVRPQGKPQTSMRSRVERGLISTVSELRIVYTGM